MESIRDALTNTTSFYYDTASRMTNVTYPGNKTVLYSYNLLGQVTSLNDSIRTITYGYGNQGVLSSSSNSVGQISQTLYDLLDRPTNIVDQNAVTITQSFDNLDRLLTRSYPDGTEKFGYTANVAGHRLH